MRFSSAPISQSALLRRLNQRMVFQTIQALGPMSRAEVSRSAGVSAPTASRAIDSMILTGLLEEIKPLGDGRGRPAVRVRLAESSTQVLGLVIEPKRCCLTAAGLDGRANPETEVSFPTPATYEQLLADIVDAVTGATSSSQYRTLGLGISLPGLLDNRAQVGLLSPNVPITNGRSLSLDLSEKLDIECEMMQEVHALCLAERHFGLARTLDDFAMLDVSAGIGLGVVSGGRLLAGHSGFAGEIGHMTVLRGGSRCTCGNSGCLETVASERAIAAAISSRAGRCVPVEEAMRLVMVGDPLAERELTRIKPYLATCIATVINLFNPATLFLHGRVFSARPDVRDWVINRASRRALGPSAVQCTVRMAQGTRSQGAIAAVIERLLDGMAPGIRPRESRTISRTAGRASG